MKHGWDTLNIINDNQLMTRKIEIYKVNLQEKISYW